MDSGRVFFLQTGAKSKVNEASQKRSLEFGWNGSGNRMGGGDQTGWAIKRVD